MCHCFLFTLGLWLGVTETANTPNFRLPSLSHHSESFFFNRQATHFFMITLIRELQPGFYVINTDSGHKDMELQRPQPVLQSWQQSSDDRNIILWQSKLYNRLWVTFSLFPSHTFPISVSVCDLMSWTSPELWLIVRKISILTCLIHVTRRNRASSPAAILQTSLTVKST